MPLGQWTNENKIRLIQEFKSHHKLWNTENDDFIKSPLLRVPEIMEITEAVNKHEEKNHFTCFLKAEYLRRRKFHRKAQKQSKDSVKEPSWMFYQYFKFLDDVEVPPKATSELAPLLDENFCKISDSNTVQPSGSALRRLRQTKKASSKLNNAKPAPKSQTSQARPRTETPNTTATLQQHPSPPSSSESLMRRGRKRKMRNGVVGKTPGLSEGLSGFDGFGAYVESSIKRIFNYSQEVAQRVRNEMKVLLYKSEVEAIGIFHDHSEEK